MNAKEFLLDILFPPLCLMCAKPLGRAIKQQAGCADCLDSIRINETIFCPVCGARLADNKRICHKDTPFRLAAAGSYEEPKLKSLITQLKYKYRTTGINALSVILDRYLAKLDVDFSNYSIIPLPLHPRRERERGFNQSLLLAQHVSARLQLPLLTNVLCKTRSTKAQAETKSHEERLTNLAGCFMVPSGVNLIDKKILLVDDVCTSGATLTEAAQTLKAAGAKSIIGFVVAKTR
jgi:competence protein ComFC